MTEITRLLALSLKAHQEAKQARAKHQHTHCRDLWQQALDARIDAHTLDPDHTDDAWQVEQASSPRGRDTHIELMQFYAERGLRAHEVTPPPIPVVQRLSIEEIRASVKAKPGADPFTTDAFTLLLLESGWITPADLPRDFEKTGAFMRFATGGTHGL